MTDEHIFLRRPGGKYYHAIRKSTMRGRCANAAEKGVWHDVPGTAATCPRCLLALAGVWEKNDPTAESWAAMKNRCKNPSHEAYARYGGKGVKVCERWAGRDGLKYFIEDMGRRAPGMTLDRIDSNGDYTPENCRWATMKTQRRNQTRRPMYTAFGRTQGLPEWAEEYGLRYMAVHSRLKRGWTLERALTTPLRTTT